MTVDAYSRSGYGRGGLPVLYLSGGPAHAEMYRLGAHVTSWRAGGRDMLWMSPTSAFASGRPIRGGIPVCFPWFGHRTGGEPGPQHGFARTTNWYLKRLAHDRPAAVLGLRDSPATRLLWPHRFALTLTVEADAALELTLAVTNTDRHPFRYEAAFHSYFAVEDVHDASVVGLQGWGYTRGSDPTRLTDDAPVRDLAGISRRYRLGEGASIGLEQRESSLRIETSGTGSAVLWNPGPDRASELDGFEPSHWMRTVCIETGNLDDGAITLSPGQTHRMRIRLRHVDKYDAERQNR
jgi:glucose-6-phosphate 1-epimerase